MWNEAEIWFFSWQLQCEVTKVTRQTAVEKSDREFVTYKYKHKQKHKFKSIQSQHSMTSFVCMFPFVFIIC